MSEPEILPPLLESERPTSVFQVLGARQIQWTTWVAVDDADETTVVRAEAHLRSQGAIVKRVGKELWYFCLNSKHKEERETLLSSQALTEWGQEQQLELAEMAFMTTDEAGAADLFIALRIFKEALLLQLTFRACQRNFIPLGSCLLAPLPELDEKSFDEELRIKPLPNGKIFGPQRQIVLNMNLAVTGDMTIAFSKTDVELVALDMHPAELAINANVYLAPSGLKANLTEYIDESADEAYRVRLGELIGYHLSSVSRWVRVRIGDAQHLWPSALTFVPHVQKPEKVQPESWFGQEDTWLDRCCQDMERKRKENQQGQQKEQDDLSENLREDTLVGTLENQSSDFAMPAAPVKPHPAKDDSAQVYPTPPEAPPTMTVKKASHDTDDEDDMHVTDADFNFFDQNSPDTIMHEIENIHHLPTPLEIDPMPISSDPAAVIEVPLCTFADMITPASQIATPAVVLTQEVKPDPETLRQESLRFRQPVPSHFRALDVPLRNNKYAPGGKYYAGTSSSSDEADQTDEDMPDANYDKTVVEFRGATYSLLAQDDSRSDDEPPPPDIPWHLLLPRASAALIKTAHPELRLQLEKLALKAQHEAQLIESIGTQLCGPSIAGLRRSSTLPGDEFNEEMFDTDWLSEQEFQSLLASCSDLFGQDPVQLTLEDLSTVYDDPKEPKVLKPKPNQRKGRPTERISHALSLPEPKMLLSRAHIDDKSHAKVLRDYEMSTAAIRYWYTAQLSPLDGPKDTVNYVFFPEGELLQNAVFRYLDDLCALYYGCHLGAFLYADKLEDAYLPFQHSELSASLTKGFEKIQTAWRSGECHGMLADNLNLVLHMVNPYALHHQQLLVFLDMVHQFKRQSGFLHITVQVVAIERICELDAFKTLDIEDCVALCLQLYNRCQLTSQDADPKLYAPAYQLAQPGIESLKGFQLSVQEFPSILDDRNGFHIAYSCTPGQPWVTVAWSDSQGQVFRATQFRLRHDSASGANEGHATIAAVFVDIWRTTMDLISVFPITWHLVITKVGKRISPDEINAWLRMGALEKGKNKFCISILCMDIEPPMLVQPPLLAYVEKKMFDNQGMSAEEQKKAILDSIQPQLASDEAIAAALEQPIQSLEDPSQVVLAVKLSKYQAGPINASEPQPLASVYLVKPMGLCLTQSAAVVLVNVYHLQDRGNVDALLQELRNLASLAHVGGFSCHGGLLPRHIMHAATMHAALNGSRP